VAVLRGDGRIGAELLEDPPEAAPEGTALRAKQAKGAGSEGTKSAKGNRSDEIALREAAEPATLPEDADGAPEGVAP